MAASCKVCRILLLILNLLVFLLACAWELMYAWYPDTGIFVKRPMDTLMDLEVKFPDYTFGMKYFLFLVNFIWIVYSLVNICRVFRIRYKRGGQLSHEDLTRLHYFPDIMPASFIYYFSIGMALNIAHLFLLDKSAHYIWCLPMATAAIILCAVALVCCMIISVHNLFLYGPWLSNYARGGDLIFIRLFVHNFVSLLAAYYAMMWPFYLGYSLFHVGQTSDAPAITAMDCTTVLFAIWGANLLGYFIFDMLMDKYMRFLVGPYLTAAYIIATTFAYTYTSANGQYMGRNGIFHMVLLGVAGILLIIKIIILIIRQCVCRHSLTLKVEVMRENVYVKRDVY